MTRLCAGVPAERAMAQACAGVPAEATKQTLSLSL